MKNILLYANGDAGLEARLQAALDLARLFEGHISCLQVTPYDAFIMGDPFGGVYALPSMIEEVRRMEDVHRNRIEDRLRKEGANWDWLRFDGNPAQTLIDRSRLADVIVLSLPGPGHDAAMSIAQSVILHARAPVLAVPELQLSLDCLGTALVAWNGAPEASSALRLALPMLRRAAAVKIVTVAEGRTEFPATDASTYLARHGIVSELHEWPAAGRGIGEVLTEAAASLRAGYVVMGAYGHTRLREAILGGATRDLLATGTVPLLMAH